MKNKYRHVCIVVALLFVLPAFAQEGKVVVANTASKELKRTAHRLRIPVDQLKNARKVLQEATDLAKAIDPYPASQVVSLAQTWTQLNRPKSKAVIDALIQDLRARAADAADLMSYQRVTSAAMMLIQSLEDTEKIRQLTDNWPEPKESWGNASTSMRKNLESMALSISTQRLVTEDPEKALALLSQSADSSNYRYSLYGQVAQGFMNAGKREDAVKVIDQTISNFDQHSDDPRAVMEFESFIRTAMNVDSTRASSAVNQWMTQMMKQPSMSGCGGTLKSGDNSVDLNCSEYRAVNLLRGMPMKPGFVMKTLDSIPELKSKLDSIGGVDNLYTNSSISYRAPGMQQALTASGGLITSNGVAATTFENPSALFQQLKGKADSNPSLVKRKLQDAVKGPESISMLINLAQMASYQDSELAGIALEVAQPLVSQVEPLQRRASSFQSLVQAYRQVDGGVDTALLKSGFVLADQLREEASAKKGSQVNSPIMIQSSMGGMIMQSGLTAGDQLESFLVSELARDSFEDAMRYARSIEDNNFKLQCMVQIVQALRSSY